MKKNLNESFAIFRPVPSPVDKIQNHFRWRIIVKGNIAERENIIFNECLREIYAQNYNKTRISIDVNPNSMM